jgi:Na+/proline symporter
VIPICGTIVAVELISRFLGARSAQVAATGTTVGGIIYFVVGLIPVFLGLMAAKLLPDLHPANVEEAEQVIARLAKEFMPGILYVTFVGAIISAVLSVVHSALHAPAAQVSHNIVVRLIPGLSDRGKLWSVRLTVMALCIVTYVISVTSEGVRELVETASSFGSAGVFVTAVFALFTRYGGSLSAYLAIGLGMLVWAAGKYAFGLSTPYLAALASAALGYVGGALVQPKHD